MKWELSETQQGISSLQYGLVLVIFAPAMLAGVVTLVSLVMK